MVSSPSPRLDEIIAGSTEYDVVAASTPNEVIAGAAIESVVAARAAIVEFKIEEIAGNAVVAAAAENRVIAGEPKKCVVETVYP